MRVHAKVHAETQKPRNRAAFSNAFFPLMPRGLLSPVRALEQP